MYLIRYYDSTISGYRIVRLRPAPSSVDYPPRRKYESEMSRDGGVVVQRPMADDRVRKWVWKGYRDYIIGYSELWRLLQSLEVKMRWDGGYDDPRVQIWDGVTGKGGFDKTIDGNAPDLVGFTNLLWTWVKFLQVDRSPREGGGPVTYDTTTVEFVIDDPAYDYF